MQKKIIIAIFVLALVIPLLSFDKTPIQAKDFCSIGKLAVPCPLGTETGPAGGEDKTFGGLVAQIISIALLVVGSVAVLFLIFGGFRYITAFGNEEQTEAAKKMIQNAIIGIIVVILSFAIIAIITNVLVKGKALPGAVLVPAGK